MLEASLETGLFIFSTDSLHLNSLTDIQDALPFNSRLRLKNLLFPAPHQALFLFLRWSAPCGRALMRMGAAAVSTPGVRKR